MFSLKEILVNESSNNSDLMLQVYWGLLACEILNGKGRDVVENTTLRKMKDLIEKKYYEGSLSHQEFNQYMTWLLHWLLMYSFTSKDLTNTGLFATILGDGSSFLNVVQMRSNQLSRYMITSFLLARGQPNLKYQIGKNALENIALPVAIESLQAGGNDVFSEFLKTIYEDYDLDKALTLVEQLGKEAEGDFLLKNYAFDIKKQAYLLIFQTKCKLFRTVDLKEVEKAMGKSNPIEMTIEDLQRLLSRDGFTGTVDKSANSMSC